MDILKNRLQNTYNYIQNVCIFNFLKRLYILWKQWFIRVVTLKICANKRNYSEFHEAYSYLVI